MGRRPLHELLLELLVSVAAGGLNVCFPSLFFLAQGDLGLIQSCLEGCDLVGGIPNTPFRE